jgi:hypothetical protein
MKNKNNKFVQILSQIRQSSYKSQIFFYDYAFPEHECPICGTICKLDQYDIRTPQHIGLEARQYLFILVGIYRCMKCKSEGKKHCFRANPDQVMPRKRNTNQTINKLKIRITEDLQSYQGAAYSTAWKWLNHSESSENEHRSYNFCGILSIDEFYPSGKCVVSIIDDKSSDVIVQEILDSADKNEIIRLMRLAKDRLEEQNIEVKQVNTDGSNLYKYSVEEVFGEGTHQRCVFHIEKDVGKQYIKAIKDNNKFEVPSGTSLKGFQVKVRYLILKGEWGFEELQFWKNVCELNPRLIIYQDIWYMFATIWDANTYEEGKNRWKTLLKLLENGSYPKESEVLKKCLLNEDTMEKSLTYLRLGTDSKTSNSIERLHRKYRKIEKIHYGLRSSITRLKRYSVA